MVKHAVDHWQRGLNTSCTFSNLDYQVQEQYDQGFLSINTLTIWVLILSFAEAVFDMKYIGGFQEGAHWSMLSKN